MDKIKVQAPAKINLFLKVLNKREDGYHNIQSVFQAIGLYDELEFEVISGDIQVNCNLDISPESNLVYKAASILKKRFASSKGVHINLTKRIPVAAGLGGGSSDAAAVLVTLNKLWGLQLSEQQLISLATEIGADVPFFIYKGAALVEGIGEKLTKWPSLPCWIVLVKPQFSISTAWAYRSLSRLNKLGLTKQENYINIFQLAWTKVDLKKIGVLMHNDFEKLVVQEFPLIEEIKQKLLTTGANGSLMSGSGSVVFGLFAQAATAKIAETRLRQFMQDRGEVFLVSTV